MLGACGDELTLTADILNQGAPGETTVAETSCLRLQSIEELEALSASDLPGDFAGYEIEEISWECTDTVEMSRLLLDIDATLISPTHQRRTVRFSADVGPDLVSVEYYPGGEWVPPHDNIVLSYYANVKRYRNYSDGSRIGPDMFYDYGHPLEFFGYRYPDNIVITPGDPWIYPNNWTGLMDFSSTDVNHMWTEYTYFDGSCWRQPTQQVHFTYNLNAAAMTLDGCVYSGEDLFPIILTKNWDKAHNWVSDWNGHNNGLKFSEMFGNYDCYLDFSLSLPFDMNDSNTYEALNLCRDVPDKSPYSFPSCPEPRNPGWYYEKFYTDTEQYSLRSKLVDQQCSFKPDDNSNPGGDMLYSVCCFYMQYLVVDGRIIHFDRLLDDYECIDKVKTNIDISRTADGYHIYTSQENHIYGAKFISDIDMFIHGVDGPEVLYDYSDIDRVGRRDKEELNKLTRSAVTESQVMRKDGKSIVIDRSLPSSLNKIKPRQTIKRKSR